MPDVFAIDKKELLDRFLRYVKVSTASAENSETYPSTAGQWDLARLLKHELEETGLSNVELDEHGYLTAILPANVPPAEAGRIPVIGFIAHLDTYPEVSGENVNPQLHSDYRGQDLVLPGDPGQTIKTAENKELLDFLGDTIITTDGTTLLGADDKAGIAAIMTAVAYLIKHPEIPRGELRVGFTPDEEVGTGTKYFDVQKFGARYAYTMDGGYPGEVESETFCADSANVTLTGRDVHPGYAKGKMINAVRAAAYFIGLLPGDSLPETTELRQGYLHPHQISGNVSEMKINFLLRDFQVEGLLEKKALLEKLLDQTRQAFPGLAVKLEIKESYRNMIYELQKEPQVVEYAVEAVRRAGVKPLMKAIRGGTDGARLSFMGLPTPNLFAGGMNFHSKQEWVAASAMVKSVETILHLIQIWREKSR